MINKDGIEVPTKWEEFRAKVQSLVLKFKIKAGFAARGRTNA